MRSARPSCLRFYGSRRLRPRPQGLDLVEDGRGHLRLRPPPHLALRVGEHDRHLVLRAVEPDVRPRDVVHDHRVESLPGELFAAALERAGAAAMISTSAAGKRSRTADSSSLVVSSVTVSTPCGGGIVTFAARSVTSA